ncbi:SusC/RagA family TonB-linked outer membrane protein [Spirosoma endbachense]|uniref:SusC/RagA family TonB-linked outer membrane protein n=1 Tax=Spirosoma endbachense TaxID=2666025 RepID=A0A6P1VVL0_9BACT|nr:SusC/RagA family TonB-linked outer membrane protein [Spirosoma endbachense]QHV95797.1 SusC/RagA family TonB-linked outer membrane protein [Spirosoma endbachense]
MKKKFSVRTLLLGSLRTSHTLLLLIALCGGVSTAHATHGQEILNKPISLTLESVDVKSVLTQIEKIASVKFVYSTQTIQTGKKVSVYADNRKLSAVLSEILTPMGVAYEEVSSRIVLRKVEVESGANRPNVEAPNPMAVVTGQVSDEKGAPIPGATVLVKNSQLGTTSDAAGKFSINAPDNSILVFSAIGFEGKEVTVGNQTQINVVLKESSQNLNEVVVTALGIKKESKKLGYATATVNTDQITVNRTTNLGNSLQGKVAGVNVTAPAGGPGGTSKIRIRGQSSFKGDNSPLIIVNGVPINNTNFSSRQGDVDGTSNRGGSAADGGDGLQSINQDDIQTLTVLKGSTAAALYGFRAKDGAIVITTKTGRSGGGIGVDYNSNFTADQALDYTDFQYEYGQGEHNIRPQTVGEAQSTGVYSFGEKIDGKPTYQFDGVQRPYTANKNRIRQFYRTGTNWTNTIALSGGNDKGAFRLSFANNDANSIMPNSDYHKRIINLSLNYQFTPKFTVQLNGNYSNEFNHNPPQIGLQDMNANTTVYTTANTVDMQVLKDGRYDENGYERATSRLTNRNNPYWVAYDRFENIHRDRLFGNATLRYQFTDWLYLQGRAGQDYYTRPYDYDKPTGTRSLAAAASGFNGYYYQEVITFREKNFDFLLGANRTFGNFSMDLTLGGNQLQQEYTNNSAAATNFYIRGLYTIMNGQIKDPQYAYSKKKVNSLYGAAEFSYKNVVFINATARNDWFSTLNPQSNSYLYPSISGSLVLSDALKQRPTWLNYAKIRAAYAEVGGDTDPYQSNLYYSLNANSFQGQALGTIGTNVSPNANLRPLKVREAEVGIELRALNNRVSLDMAVYRKNTVDEILNVGISNASGYDNTKVNVGRLRNQGVEMLLTLVPVKAKDINWETSFNVTYNESLVLALADNQPGFKVGQGDFFGEVWQEVGKPMASLRGFAYKRDAQGQIITAGGKPVAGDFVTFGSAIPKWTGGWLNTVTYKGIRIFTQIDFKAGNKIISNSNLNFLRHGLSKESLVGREGGVVFNGVNADGSKNTQAVDAEDFYASYRSTNLAEPFIYNGGFVRWRALSVGYDLSRFVNKTFIKGLTLSAICNNVLMIKKFLPNLDPEAVNGASDNIQGIETHTLPTTRSYGLNLSLKL